MSRASVSLMALVLGVLGAGLMLPGCTTAQAEPLDVTYYYLPG